MEERRRSRRYSMHGGELALLPYTMSVQVIDLSVAGVLLQANRPVEVGTRACLRMNVGGSRFSTDVQVQRVSGPAEGKEGGYRIGAMFVGITPEDRQKIERFIN